jgi:hypothetical protein
MLPIILVVFVKIHRDMLYCLRAGAKNRLPIYSSFSYPLAGHECRPGQPVFRQGKEVAETDEVRRSPLEKGEIAIR